MAPRADPAAAAPPASTAAAEPDADAAAAPPPPATTAGSAVPAGHATGAQRAAEASWQSRLLGHLEGFRRYPMRALRQRHEGVTYLRFSVDRRGAVTAVRLERGSGSAALDAEALEVVRRAQPLPAPPREIEGDPVEVVVPVEFRLRRR
ncbi:energy transducer TonB [Dokdonella koreensis]|uniref:energy transducer TonB n=1 Tax=Dokdonella koreensis TaxID=323415 RepID=UPI001CBC8C74|nr:energy transducer TonB [Dokdonella koreensis]